MSRVLNDKSTLSPRQIINRYRKGEYVDESIEAISSAISSCHQSFNCNSVPFPSNIIDKVYENISLCKTMYERQKEGRGVEDIEVPDYPQLKEILLDLSCPPLWESMQKKDIDIQFIKIIKAKGLMGKYRLDVEQDSCHKITSVVSLIYGKAIEEVGLSPTDFSLCLNFMVR